MSFFFVSADVANSKDTRGSIPKKANRLSDKSTYCCYCAKSFKNKGDCSRHVREVHIQPKAYLCPLVGICPRSIIGNGFGRMHQLIDHLKSGVHNMTPGQARMEAHRHNFNRKHNTGVEVEVNVISSNNNNNINGAAADDDQY